MADDAPRVFRALVESADKKFVRVRDVPAYAGCGGKASNHYFQKVFKAYMRLWKFQQENRAKLVESGLQRWEIGEIASRIGQLYFGQYMRTSEARFLLESYVFYEAILNRKYFQGGGERVKDLGIRSKELRFYARFLLVSLLLNRHEMVYHLVENFRAVVDDSKATFRETNFKEWKTVVQEINRFTKADAFFGNARPLRYCAMFDAHPDSLPYLARFHAKKLCKLHDAVLTAYHRNEVKFAELSLDTYRMLQCLEWEPSGSFYQKRPVEVKENGRLNNDYSCTSGMIDINLAVDLTDPSLPPNPVKAILYRPTVTHFLAILSTVCDELPPDTIMLIYLSCSGGRNVAVPQVERVEGSRVVSKVKVVPQSSHESSEVNDCEKGYLNSYYANYLSLGPRGHSGSNNLYPGDLIPFTRRPLFLVIDSDTSHAFKTIPILFSHLKTQKLNEAIEDLNNCDRLVLNGAEMGEPVALLLSPLKSSFKTPSEVTLGASQFTYFLTAPLQAFCQLVGLHSVGGETDTCDEAENIISNSFSKWEVILCTSPGLDLVWAQVLLDPFLRRLILRFIFCRAVLFLFQPPEERYQYLPVCVPDLLSTLSPEAEAVKSSVIRLADHLRVSDNFKYKV